MSERAVPSAAPRQEPATILLVDDHPANLLALEAILEPLGQRLLRAESGDEALRQLLYEDCAVILLDVHMPGLDGFQTARLIKQRPRSRHIPIIFLTAHHRETQSVIEGYARGAVDYMSKPFEPAVLQSKVAVFVELYQRGREIERQAELLRQRDREIQERRSEARFRLLVDSMPQCVWAARPDGEIYYWNRVAVQYAGLRQPRASVRALLRLVHREDRRRLAEAWQDALGHGEHCELEVRLRSARTQRHRWHLLGIVPQKDERGAIEGWVATATDLDDHKRAEAALTEFKATLDSTVDGVIIFEDDDLRLRYANRGAALQLGYGREELVGMRLTEVAAGLIDGTAASDEAVRVALAPLVDGREHFQTFRARHLRKDGSELPVEVVLQYVPRAGGGGRFVCVTRDLTERQAVEAALRNANEAKDAFLAAASHELRTPLTAAQMQLHLALTRCREGRGFDAVVTFGKLHKQVGRMAKLVDNLLDISLLQTGRMSLDLAEFDLCALLKETCERIQDLSTAHPIDLRVAGELLMRGDKSRIDQVFTNLLTNAVRYSPDGGAIVVEARVEGGHVHTSVRDHGLGIPPEKQRLIFERFGRAHGSEFGGLGLGLTISQGIVEQHGGRLWVESTGRAGEGSLFHVDLPSEASREQGAGSRRTGEIQLQALEAQAARG